MSHPPTRSSEIERPAPLEPLATKSRGIPAWLLSLGLHFTVITTLAVVVQDAPRRSASLGIPLRDGGIVIVKQTAGKTEYFSEEAAAGPLSPDTSLSSADASAAAAALPEILPSDLPGPQLPTGEQASGAALEAMAIPGASEAVRGGGGKGTRPGVGNGSEAETQVFGITGKGSRFVYVFDRSGSMEGYGGRPIAAAKEQLIESISHLGNVHQFQIIFYNERPEVMNPFRGQSLQLFFGNERDKELAQRFVRGIVASGGTEHLVPLKMALKLDPDVIFFLTDADEPALRPEELESIHRMNRGTTIHAIEFGAGPKASRWNFLQQIAKENGGEHRYIDVTSLPAR